MLYRFKKIKDILSIYVKELRVEKRADQDRSSSNLSHLNHNIVTAIKRKKMYHRINDHLKKIIDNTRRTRKTF